MPRRRCFSLIISLLRVTLDADYETMLTVALRYYADYDILRRLFIFNVDAMPLMLYF